MTTRICDLARIPSNQLINQLILAEHKLSKVGCLQCCPDWQYYYHHRTTQEANKLRNELEFRMVQLPIELLINMADNSNTFSIF